MEWEGLGDGGVGNDTFSTSASSLTMVTTSCSSSQAKTLITFLFSYHNIFLKWVSVFSLKDSKP